MSIKLKTLFIFFLTLIISETSFSKDDINKAENWLNNIASMTADFIQVSSDGVQPKVKYILKKILLDQDYNFITSFLGDCGFFPGFNLIDSKSKKIDDKCNNLYFDRLLKKINTYSIAFSNKGYDESQYAKKISSITAAFCWLVYQNQKIFI